MGLFSRKSVARFATSLARYLPGGRLFTAKQIAGSTLYRILLGQSAELWRANGQLWEYQNNILPDTTLKFLSDWERVVGIPDDCFGTSGTIDERRRNVLIKLAAGGVQTVEDFQALADQFNTDATVIPGSDFGTPFAFSEFTLLVEWTTGSQADIDTLTCLFTHLKPANVRLLFLPLNIFAVAGEQTMQCGESFAQCGNRLI